jgi:hypothetical protein
MMAACGNAINSPNPDGGGGGDAGGGGDHVTAVGQSVYTGSVQERVLENLGGGFTEPPPPAAACNPKKSKYTLTIASHQLDWVYCLRSGTGTTYEPKIGGRKLDDGEWTALQPALQKLIVDDGKSCGADKPMLVLTVTTANGDLQRVRRRG